MIIVINNNSNANCNQIRYNYVLVIYQNIKCLTKLNGGEDVAQGDIHVYSAYE